MSTVDDLVLRRFYTLYGPPTTDDEASFLDEYCKALGGADPALLAEAVDALVKRQSIPAWPTAGACWEALNEVAERRAAEAGRTQRRSEPPGDEPTSEQRARVQALVQLTAARITEKAKRREGKPILDALYEEIHGRPYRAEDWT